MTKRQRMPDRSGKAATILGVVRSLRVATTDEDFFGGDRGRAFQRRRCRGGWCIPLEKPRQLRTHLADFLAEYNFARTLTSLNGLTPYKYICNIRTSKPERFNQHP